MESALAIAKPHQGKILHPRRWHRGNQAVSRGRRWGKSNRSYDGTSELPEFQNGALTGAFSRLFNDVVQGRNSKILQKVRDDFSPTAIKKSLSNEAFRIGSMDVSDFNVEMAPNGFRDLGSENTIQAQADLANDLRTIVRDELVTSPVGSGSNPSSRVQQGSNVIEMLKFAITPAADLNFTYGCSTTGCNVERINVQFPN